METEREIWTVSRLNREARLLIETSFRVVWLEGELSNIAQPASGHLYFSLKDASAQLRCAMFRSRRQLLKFKPADGAHVIVRGRVSLYEPRGEFQFVAEHMEEAGSGALQREFENLKRRLGEEGLFDEALKRALPAMPARIGVITSPTGAAIRDIVSVLERRFPSVPVVVYPVPVQGAIAPARIVAMLHTAGTRAECDVLILARGGGSIEDLWAFNDEAVARAIRACPIPVVTGIGHEIDFTIADFAADRRAPTPSAAAELVVPDRVELRRRLSDLARLAQRRVVQRIVRDGERVQWLEARLRQLHPGRRLQQQSQRLDEMEQRLRRAWDRRHERAGVRVASAARALHAVSPLATLARGYAIVTTLDGDVAVTDARRLTPGDTLRARFARGQADLTVQETKDD